MKQHKHIFDRTQKKQYREWFHQPLVHILSICALNLCPCRRLEIPLSKGWVIDYQKWNVPSEPAVEKVPWMGWNEIALTE